MSLNFKNQTMQGEGRIKNLFDRALIKGLNESIVRSVYQACEAKGFSPFVIVLNKKKVTDRGRSVIVPAALGSMAGQFLGQEVVCVFRHEGDDCIAEAFRPKI